MDTKDKKKTACPVKNNEDTGKKQKSRFTLFREKYPNGVGEIIDMRAVLR
jgi:hypothetical protein